MDMINRQEKEETGGRRQPREGRKVSFKKRLLGVENLQLEVIPPRGRIAGCRQIGAWRRSFGLLDGGRLEHQTKEKWLMRIEPTDSSRVR